MAQPIVKYTLNKKGQIPEWINTSNSSFASEHGITGNKTGYIPKYESPQDITFLGIASGDPDPDGTPDDYVGILTTKALLQTYITETGSTLKYKTVTQQSQVFKLQQQLDYPLHGVKQTTLVDYQHQQPQNTQLPVLEQLQPYLHHK